MFFYYLLHHFSHYKIRTFLAIISSVLNKLCDIAPEILIGISIDVVINQQSSMIAHLTGIKDSLTQLYLVCGLTALCWIFESIFEYIYLILWKGLAQDILHKIRTQTYRHLLNLDISYFEEIPAGEIQALVNDDINELESFIGQGPNEIIQFLVNALVMGGVFTYFSPKLSLLTVLPIPIVIAIAYYFHQKLGHLYGVVRHAIARLSSHSTQRILGITTIKSYATESHETASFVEQSNFYKNINNKTTLIHAAYIPIVRMGILAGFIMSLFVGGTLVLNGHLPISFYCALVFLTQRFLWPFTTITSITDMYERAKVCAQRIINLHQLKPKITEGLQELLTPTTSKKIAFENVSFGYQKRKTLFNNLSFTIPANATVAFVGSTGSGKSSITKLLLRFYEHQQGSILLDESPIQSYTLHSLRKAIALVSQETFLINGTVLENIGYGLSTSNKEELVEVAKMAEAHEFIMQLPQGYETILGENGKTLSGGQRQRLAIARALAKNSGVLIFDEATSALDNETEVAIKKSIQNIAHKHTIILIAHRISTVRHADIIFVMDEGSIIEQGTHESLINLNKQYAKLWRLQIGE